MLKFLIKLQCEYKYIRIINRLIDDLQLSFLFFYLTYESLKIRVLSRDIYDLIFYSRDHIVWSISLSSIDLYTFRENHVILVNLELSYLRINHDLLYLIRCTRQVALWQLHYHAQMIFIYILLLFYYYTNFMSKKSRDEVGFSCVESSQEILIRF